MFQEDDPITIRLYDQKYSEDLFAAKWREHAPKILSMFVSDDAFNKAMTYFYGQHTLVAKLLGKNNVDVATRAFYLENISLELGVEFKYSEDTIKLVSSATETLRLLKRSEAEDQFKAACSAFGHKWDTVKNTLVPLMDKLYKEQLIMVKISANNAAALALAFEDAESVDLKVRLKLSTVPPPIPAPIPPAPSA